MRQPAIITPTRSDRLARLADWSLGERRLEPYRADRQARLSGSLIEAIDACDLHDGAVIGFHHHFRNGDHVVLKVVEALAAFGRRDLTIAASSFFPAHEALLPFIRTGVIGAIVGDYVRGPLAGAIVAGELPRLSVLQSHGGRARAIESGEFKIDAAFIGASLAHVSGAATGRGGALACGPLGYAMVDAAHAGRVVVLADTITADPLSHIDIPAHHVDFLVSFPSPGDPLGIESGSTLAQATPTALAIANSVREVVTAAGLIPTQPILGEAPIH